MSKIENDGLDHYGAGPFEQHLGQLALKGLIFLFYVATAWWNKDEHYTHSFTHSVVADPRNDLLCIEWDVKPNTLTDPRYKAYPRAMSTLV